MRTRSGSLYSNNGGEAAVGQKRKRTAAPMGPSAVAGECAGGARRKRLAGGPDYLDVLPDDLVLSILSKLAASASAPSNLLSVHLTYVSLAAAPPHRSASLAHEARNPSCFFGLQALPLPVSPRALQYLRCVGEWDCLAVYGNIEAGGVMGIKLLATRIGH